MKEKLKKSKLYLKVTEKLPLRVLGENCLVEEFPIAPQVDKASGLTKDVVDSIASGTLVIPETAQYALEKFPFQGKVIATGKDVKEVKVGDTVLFAKLGGMRWEENGKQVIAIAESHIIAILS